MIQLDLAVKVRSYANIMMSYRLIGWQLSIWICRSPFSSLLYNYQLLCFWRLALSIAVDVVQQPFFRILLLQERLLQTRYV